MKTEKIGKISTILLVIACIVFIIGLVLTNIEIQKADHNVDDITIEMKNITTKVEQGYYNTDYYVYMDFEIRNNTRAQLDYFEVTSYLTDENGKSLGYITSNFGSSYSYSNQLNLESGENTVITNYLTESGTNWGTVFAELYNNGIQNCSVRHEITRAMWSDDYIWDIND